MYCLASPYENTSIASHARPRQRWLILFSLDVMMPRRSPDLVYVPRIWPVFAISSGAALVVWLLAFLVGHASALPSLAGVSFCVGVLAFILFLLLKYRIFVIAPETWELPLFRVSVGLWWGAFVLLLLFYR